MSDVAITWDAFAQEGVISFDPATNDLRSDDGLTTAVIISLFTDARANDDDVLPDSLAGEQFPDRRGCWMDETSEKENDSIGSRLWLLERSAITPEVLVASRQYVLEALQWMVDDGIASEIQCVTEQIEDHVHFEVTIIRNTGESVSYQFDALWEGI